MDINIMATCEGVRPVASSALGTMMLQHSTGGSSLSARNGSHLKALSLLAPLQGRGLSLSKGRSRQEGHDRRILRSSRVLAASAASDGSDDARKKKDLVKKNGSSVPAEKESTDIQTTRGPPRPLLRSLAEDMDDFFPSVTSLSQMLDTMDRMFDDPFFGPGRQIRSLGSRPLRSSIRTPWDVVEEEKAYLLRVDIPGFSKEEVQVYVEEGDLVIKAESQSADEKESKFASRSHGSFSSRLLLPDNVDIEKISAELKNGVLIVTVPKLEKAPKKDVIDIRVL